MNYLYWFHFANGSMIPSFMLDAVMQQAAAASNGSAARAPDSRSERALQMIEDRLARASFFAGGQFSAADIMMCLMLVFGTRDVTPYPHVKAYLQRLGQRPGCRRAMAKAEPNRPVPPWIDAHGNKQS